MSTQIAGIMHKSEFGEDVLRFVSKRSFGVQFKTLQILESVLISIQFTSSCSGSAPSSSHCVRPHEFLK
jgi:hypothetical protein